MKSCFAIALPVLFFAALSLGCAPEESETADLLNLGAADTSLIIEGQIHIEEINHPPTGASMVVSRLTEEMPGVVVSQEISSGVIGEDGRFQVEIPNTEEVRQGDVTLHMENTVRIEDELYIWDDTTWFEFVLHLRTIPYNGTIDVDDWDVIEEATLMSVAEPITLGDNAELCLDIVFRFSGSLSITEQECGVSQ